MVRAFSSSHADFSLCLYGGDGCYFHLSSHALEFPLPGHVHSDRVAHEKPARLVGHRGRRSRTPYRKLNKCKCKDLYLPELQSSEISGIRNPLQVPFIGVSSPEILLFTDTVTVSHSVSDISNVRVTLQQTSHNDSKTHKGTHNDGGSAVALFSSSEENRKPNPSLLQANFGSIITKPCTSVTSSSQADFFILPDVPSSCSSSSSHPKLSPSPAEKLRFTSEDPSVVITSSNVPNISSQSSVIASLLEGSILDPVSSEAKIHITKYPVDPAKMVKLERQSSTDLPVVTSGSSIAISIAKPHKITERMDTLPPVHKTFTSSNVDSLNLHFEPALSAVQTPPDTTSSVGEKSLLTPTSSIDSEGGFFLSPDVTVPTPPESVFGDDLASTSVTTASGQYDSVRMRSFPRGSGCQCTAKAFTSLPALEDD
ncbi:unnamed protein product [Darwinula stevensoni]|uniref:Uncharacterized protein n=1 Tax=Darwinula stevensoni TaxID=69355 RepID=A0A7R8X5A8_9CRUS|nr:unnamed protein product [Darwinula stevensoni]CAG0884592.1 unnamed protein product [Darwinula stevensoni]